VYPVLRRAVPHGGAEVDIAVLFADVRGSTALGERTPAADFAALLDRFYVAATQMLMRRDAVIDKLPVRGVRAGREGRPG
jgi:class 3 adenylate cyclase